MATKDRPQGNHASTDPSVTDTGRASDPSRAGPGHPKPSASKARGQGKPEEGTSSATAGEAEMEHAAVIGAQKPRARHD
jgi:hypothetical protein